MQRNSARHQRSATNGNTEGVGCCGWWVARRDVMGVPEVDCLTPGRDEQAKALSPLTWVRNKRPCVPTGRRPRPGCLCECKTSFRIRDPIFETRRYIVLAWQPLRDSRCRKGNGRPRAGTLRFRLAAPKRIPSSRSGSGCSPSQRLQRTFLLYLLMMILPDPRSRTVSSPFKKILLSLESIRP